MNSQTKRRGLSLGLVVAAVGLASCSGGGNDQAWFDENCAAQAAEIKKAEAGQLVGDAIGEAIIQGPMVPPGGLDDSAETFGLYTYDEAAETMQEAGEVAAGDAFCMEPGMKEGDRGQTIDVGNVEGDRHADQSTVDFTMLRSPGHPDGVWVDVHSSELPEAIPAEEAAAECQLDWWLSADLIDSEAERPTDGEIGSHNVESQEDC